VKARQAVGRQTPPRAGARLVRWVGLIAVAVSLQSAASASADASCPNASFRTGPAAQLPDCRAYEQVSPVEKNGSDAGVTGAGGQGNPDLGAPVATNGNATAFQAVTAFADAEWGGALGMQYLSQRDAEGWHTRAIAPPSLDHRGAGGAIGFDSTMESLIYAAGVPLTPDPFGSFAFYSRDPITGELDLLTTLPSDAPQPFPLGIEMSSDLTHLAFAAEASMTDDPEELPSGAGQYRVFEYTKGELRLVSRQPGTNKPFTVASKLGGSNIGTRESRQGAVSEDGAHIYFTAGEIDSATIYRRSNGTTTAVASPSRRSSPDPGGPRGKSFKIASADGERVFFTSAEQLTDDANDANEAWEGDLYRYDFATDELTDLSAGTPGVTPALVSGVLDISDDGDRAYFAAYGELVPGKDEYAPKLYLWEDDGTATGTVRYIATLNEGDTGINNIPDFSDWDPNELYKVSQATPDGSRLVFQATENLTGENPTAEYSQVYLYDAEAGAGAGSLSCLSCGSPTGLTTAAFIPSFFSPLTGSPIGAIGQNYVPVISDDGSRAIFSSPDPLLPADTNDRTDAYLWDEGSLMLLSTGTDSDNSYAHGLSASGDDAFFRTRQALVPQDDDTLVDIYTARVNGGLASQFAGPPPVCSGEECRGAGSAPPAAQGALTSSFSGPGNLPRRPRCPKGKHKVKTHSGKTRCVKRKAGKGKRSSHNRRASR
jgi:hypothetical protein